MRLLAVLLACASFCAQAQSFPSRPVRIMVGSAAGGGTDIVSRLLAAKLQEAWGQPVVVENRTGASASIAADFVAKSPPDGHTVVMAVPNSHTIAPHLVKLPYDPLRDFTPITLAVQVPHVLVVSQSSPVKSMRELVELARASPGKLNFSSSGVGATQHLAGELFNLVTGVKTVHVPYKGSAAAMGDLIAGVVTMSFDTTASSIGNIRAGKLRALAVAAPARAAALQDVPTTAEAGFPGVEMITWYGLFGPANMPRALTEKWRQDVARALGLPDMRERVAALAGEPGGNAPEEFAAYIREQYAKMGKLVKDAEVRAE
ncbi:MAG TPA: tripartite tricarboxylate transporter substrate binding protein [Burkholderiales bacterium]|nr:tripartite tricarboxylate transporter substrate binding protein [Burkholderiales bacterium]